MIYEQEESPLDSIATDMTLEILAGRPVEFGSHADDVYAMGDVIEWINNHDDYGVELASINESMALALQHDAPLAKFKHEFEDFMLGCVGEFAEEHATRVYNYQQDLNAERLAEMVSE